MIIGHQLEISLNMIKPKIVMKKKVLDISSENDGADSKKTEIQLYTCLSALKNSNIYEDQLIYMCLLDMLAKLTKKSEDGLMYIVSKENETLDNQKYVLENWSTFVKLFGLPNRLKRNQKLVSQVIKYIINEINSRYQFDNPIQMTTKQKSYLFRDQLNQQKETKITFTEINL